MKLLLDCRSMAKLLSQSYDKVPPRVIQARMRLHLMSCQACRNVEEQMHFVRTAMEELNAYQLDSTPSAQRLQ